MSRRNGAVLLEVVLALALFVAAAGVILSGLSSAIGAAERLRLDAHGINLAASTLAQLELGTRPADTTEPTPFLPPFDDWTWEIRVGTATGFDDEGDGQFVLGGINDARSGPLDVLPFRPLPLRRVEVIARHTSGFATRLAQLVRINSLDPSDLPSVTVDEARVKRVKAAFEAAEAHFRDGEKTEAENDETKE